MAPKLRNIVEPSRVDVEDPKFVVAIDFGTTFSKAAYAESPHLVRGFLDIEKMVHLITDWPSQEAGVGGKCFKTKTCVWYMPGAEPDTYEFKGWGWEAYVQYKKLVQSLAKTKAKIAQLVAAQAGSDSMERSSDGGSESEQLLLSKQHGYLIDCFKLRLYDPTLDVEDLPKGLSLVEVISDFLRGMSSHILCELQQKHGRNVCKRDIKWCITVPALWEECHRQSMEDCAEMAGLVLGPSCRDTTASPHDLITVLEPEAASIYCHNTLKLLCKGDTFAVIDFGGGTTDLVTHQRIGSTKRSTVRVKEVSESIGGLCGGAHVDEGFLEYLRNKISTPTCECFSDFEKTYPAQVLDLLIHWGRIKASYNGEVECCKEYELDIPRALAKRWKRSHLKYLQTTFESDIGRAKNHVLPDYNQIQLRGSTVKRIFDKQIESIFSLINERDVDSVDFVLIVGGFSESPYVRKRIMERFTLGVSVPHPNQSEKPSKVVFPRNPDTAVVRGAVALGVLGEWESFVKSRIAKRTYGFDTTVPFDEKLHPPEYVVYQDDSKEKLCDHIFEVVIRRGDEVPFNSKVEFNTRPLYRQGYSDDENIEITLYSTRERNPKFVTQKGVTKEATCSIAVPKTGREGNPPQLRIRVHFGGTRIRFMVWGTNFTGEKIAMPPVRLTCTSQNHREHQAHHELLGKRANSGSRSRTIVVKRERVS